MMNRIIRLGLIAIGGGLCAHCLLLCFPSLELQLLARCAAEAASLFTGAPVVADEAGWRLPHSQFDLFVSEACSGTDFYMMLTVLLCWHFAARRSALLSILLGLVFGLIGSLFVNGLRVILVTQTSSLQLTLLPESYQSFAHLLLGIAVFLPALVLVNLMFEYYGRIENTSDASVTNG